MDYGPDELEFFRAIEHYKRDNHRPYPTWHEVMLVFLSLGFRKVADKTTVPKFKRGEGNEVHAAYEDNARIRGRHELEGQAAASEPVVPLAPRTKRVRGFGG